MLECVSAGFCMLMKSAYGVVVRGKHMGRAITSATVIMTDARIGLTISSYHHQLVMSNEDVFARPDHQRLRINTPQRGSYHDVSQRRRHRLGHELRTYNEVMKKLCRL